MPEKSSLKTFGQEFHPHEAIRALRLAEKMKTGDRKLLSSRIAAELPQSEKSTRERIAGKLIQRYLKASRSKIAPWNTQDFAHLVAGTRHAATQIELLYFELTKTDELVGTIARELFFPVCVLNVAPEEYSAVEFAARNGSRLMVAAAPLLTREFILHHARTRWDFKSVSSLDRSLRILQSAGLIARERMTELRDHPAAFRMAAHDVSPVTFAWALYDEFLPRLESGASWIAREEFSQSNFARLLLLNHGQVEQGIEVLRRHQYLAASQELLRLVLPNRSTLIEALLAKAL